MSEYTPSLDEARDRYADARAGVGEWTRFDDSVLRAVEDAYAEFDRWLADHDAKVRAEALREAAEGMRPGVRGSTCNEACHRADQIALEMRADRIEQAAGRTTNERG